MSVAGPGPLSRDEAADRPYAACMSLQQDLSGEPAGPRPLGATLYFEDDPGALDMTAVRDRIRGLGQVDVHEGLLVMVEVSRFHQAPAPVTCLTAGPAATTQPVVEGLPRTQLWQLGDEADATLERCHHMVSVLQMMGQVLPAEAQVHVLAEVVAAMARVHPSVVAVRFMASDDVYARDDLLQRAEAGGRWWASTAFNVRYFRVEGREGECVVDTLGLYALGLPDVQVHARGLDPDQLVPFAGNLGLHLLARGDVIEDGHTVDGVDGSRWTCQHEASLIQPVREVLDADPGRYAAGGRERHT